MLFQSSVYDIFKPENRAPQFEKTIMDEYTRFKDIEEITIVPIVLGNVYDLDFDNV